MKKSAETLQRFSGHPVSMQVKLSCHNFMTSAVLWHNLSCRYGWLDRYETTRLPVLQFHFNVCTVFCVVSGVPRYSVISTLCKSFVFSTNLRVRA